MNSLNSILLDGNMVDDAKTVQVSTGSEVTSFSVASDRWYRKGDDLEKEVNFIEVKLWNAKPYIQELTKGRYIRVVGRLKQERWNDAEGNPHSKHVIIADHIEAVRQSAPAESETEPETAEA